MRAVGSGCGHGVVVDRLAAGRGTPRLVEVKVDTPLSARQHLRCRKRSRHNGGGKNMSVIERLVEAISNKDIDAYGSLYSNEAVMYEPLLPEPARGKSAIIEGEAALFRAFSDITINVKNQLGSGRVMMAEVVLSATNDGPLDVGTGEVPATGRRIEVPMVWALDLNEEGLVVQERDYFDTARIIQQLGLDE
jgi:steroid delta-isomerase-like uncharacterized protein